MFSHVFRHRQCLVQHYGDTPSTIRLAWRRDGYGTQQLYVYDQCGAIDACFIASLIGYCKE